MNSQLSLNVSVRNSGVQANQPRLGYSHRDLENICYNCYCNEGVTRVFGYTQIRNEDDLGKTYAYIKLCNFCYQYSLDTSSPPKCARDDDDFINQLSFPCEKRNCLCCQEYCMINNVFVRYFDPNRRASSHSDIAVVGLCSSCCEIYTNNGICHMKMNINTITTSLQKEILDNDVLLCR